MCYNIYSPSYSRFTFHNIFVSQILRLSKVNVALSPLLAHNRPGSTPGRTERRRGGVDADLGAMDRHKRTREKFLIGLMDTSLLHSFSRSNYKFLSVLMLFESSSSSSSSSCVLALKLDNQRWCMVFLIKLEMCSCFDLLLLYLSVSGLAL